MRWIVVLLALLAGVSAAAPATAATFTVTTTVDVSDSNTGDGICSGGAPAANACTLRAAIEQAGFLAGTDTIVLPAGTYQLAIALGQLDTTSSLIINGAGARETTIRAAAGRRVINAGGDLRLTGMTLTGGSVSTSANVIEYGGALRVGAGEAHLERVTVRDNTLTSAGGAYGGGIGVVSGSLTLLDSAVQGNTATAPVSDFGTGSGGGIYTAAPLTVRRSTIAGNLTRNYMTMTESSGGGLAISGQATIEHSTIANNSAEGGIGTQRGGGINVSSGASVSIGGSIIAGNNASDLGANCSIASGTVTETAKNLVGNSDCLGSAQGSLKNINPQLGALGDNGGPTDTMRPANGSPAVGAASSCGTRPADQRGSTPLPIGSACDLGAVELGADRSVQLQASKTAAAAGDDVTLVATINNGTLGDHATDETLTLELPAGATATLATSTLGSCTTGATVSCALGTLNRGAGATITAVVKASGADMAITARRGGPVPDGSPSNDAASVSVAGIATPGGPGGPGAPGPGGPGASDLTPPVLSALKLSKKPTTKKGATLTLTLSEAAKVTVVIERSRSGRRSGARCVAGRKTGKRCTAYSAVKKPRTTATLLPAGNATIKLPGSALRTGKLRLTITATDGAGNTSAPATVRATVKAR